MFKKISILVLFLISLFTLAACDGKDGYKDEMAEPDDLPEIGDIHNVKYPEKPSWPNPGQKPGTPTIGTATTESKHYNIAQSEGGFNVTYNAVDRWDYVYLPIEGFNKEHQNIKISATAQNVDKIAIAVIYYEMYEEGYPAVAAFTKDVIPGEQYFVLQLGKVRVKDAEFKDVEKVNPEDPTIISYETLGDKTVIGLCIFIDSNPAQPTYKDGNDCSLNLTKFEFLPDGDKGLGDIYVPPVIGVGEQAQEIVSPYTVEQDEETKNFTLTRPAKAQQYSAAWFTVKNYTSDYTALSFAIDTTNVKHISIEVLFNGGKVGSEWQPQVTLETADIPADGQYAFEIDFTDVQPQGMDWNLVPNYFIKNYNINTIKIYLDTAAPVYDANMTEATAVISDFKFIRTAVDENTITKKWSPSNSPEYKFSDVNTGGVGTVTYKYVDKDNWASFEMPIANYTPVNKITIKFQTSDPIKHIGIALVSGNFTSQNGEVVLKQCFGAMESTEIGTLDAEGVVQMVDIDSVTNTYTITFDFTNAKVVASYKKPINQMPISRLRFYMTDAVGDDKFDGERTITFLGITME